MKFTTLVIIEETNSNISVYETIKDNAFLEILFCFYSRAVIGAVLLTCSLLRQLARAYH